MKKLKKMISHHWLGVVLVLVGLLGWKWGMSLLGDNAAIVGPDRIVYKFVNLVGLGAALIATLLLVRGLFNSVWKFTDPLDFGNARESEFEKSWKTDRTDPRLWISVITYLLVFHACVQAFSS